MKTILFSILFFSYINLFAQEVPAPDPKWFSFSTNLIEDEINEANINVERELNSRFSIGANLASVYYHNIFSVVFLSPSQNYWPGTVYRGYSFRFYVKWYSKINPTKYISLQAIYKTESFNNVGFFDAAGNDEQEDFYTRTEKASVYGMDLLFGHEHTIGKTKLFYDIFYGMGLRSRYRDGTTLTIWSEGWASPPAPSLGPYQIDQFYPTFIFGLKFGVYYLK